MVKLAAVLALLLVVPAASAQEYPELGVMVETVAENLRIPWSIDWTPDGTALFTERGGDLRAIQDGVLVPEPLLSVEVSGVEGGLLGVAVDPDFGDNRYVYLYYTYNEFISTANKVVRYQFADGVVAEDMVLIDGIPGGPFHDGGRIQFGPDGKLYITTGDAGNANLAQDPNSLAGKILRVNRDGTIPEDNPFDGSPVWSVGHRNPQGVDWDMSGNLVATEHGPSGLRGVAHDEINLIVPGANYGWPDIIGDESAEGLQVPILHTGEDTWAPSGAEFYDGDRIPKWTGKYFVATLRGSHLHVVDLDLQNNSVISHERLFQGEFGRLRDVQTGPNGLLYLLTSNRDGRGHPDLNDDRILRVVPLSVGVGSFDDCVAAGNPVMESHPRQCSTADGLRFVDVPGGCVDVSESDPISVSADVEDLNPGILAIIRGCVHETARTGMISVMVLDPDGRIIQGYPVVLDHGGSFAVPVIGLDHGGIYSATVDLDGQNAGTTTFAVPDRPYARDTPIIAFVGRSVGYNDAVPDRAHVGDAGITIDAGSRFWRDHFEVGDTVSGEVHFFGQAADPGKASTGTADIMLTMPSGRTVTMAGHIPVSGSYVEFAIPVAEGLDPGAYLLHATYTADGAGHPAEYQAAFHIGQSRHFLYAGEGGPLSASAQYVEYAVSPISFDIDSKSVSFDFERLDDRPAPPGHPLQAGIGVLIERPLISPPYVIAVESDSGTAYREDHKIGITEDNFYRYELVPDEGVKRGTVTITGTYVIPEFGIVASAVLVIGLASMAVLSSRLLPGMRICR